MMSKKKFKVLSTYEAVDQYLEQLAPGRFEISPWYVKGKTPRNKFIEAMRGKDGVVLSQRNLEGNIDGAMLDEIGPQLKTISSLSVGYEYIDVEETKKRGIRVGYLPRVQNKVVAEMAIALLLSFDRAVFKGKHQITSNEWSEMRYTAGWNCGIGLDQSVVGIVGLGEIGLEIAKLNKAFGARKILYYGKSGQKSEGDAIGAEYSTFENLLSESEFVIVSCPLNNETENLFNEKAFSLMRTDALFVNISRGGIVDQEALIKALQLSWIRGAALDVMTPEPLPTDHILTKLPNCLLTPHSASNTVRAKDAMNRVCAENLIAALEGKPMFAEL